MKIDILETGHGSVPGIWGNYLSKIAKQACNLGLQNVN